MEFTLNPLKSYQKTNAKAHNNFKLFLSKKDKIFIDLSLFGTKAPASIFFANSKKDYKKSQKSNAPFIYYRKKGFLLFNQNGEGAKLGEGGIAALFPKKLRLQSKSFRFLNNTSSDEDLTSLPILKSKGVFVSGPRPSEISSQDTSGTINVGGEVDRIPVTSSEGDVVSLFVSAPEGTYPLVRLVNSDGNILATSNAYNTNSASTSGYRSKGELLFAEVYTQLSFTGDYELEANLYKTDLPLRSNPENILILLDQNSMQSADQYASKYLFNDGGLIYISFGSGLTDELKGWWEDVLAATDLLIEPEFIVVPQNHPKSQILLNQTSASSVSGGAAGNYQSPSYTWSELADGGKYNYRRLTQQGDITLSEGVYTHASRFAGSREGAWKSTAFHELGHALGLEHPHESSDGDVDYVIDTNGTVMSYEKEQDLDGDPSFTDLDIEALQFIYGSESGESTPSPLVDIPLLIDSRDFDLSKRWKAPQLTVEWVGGNSVAEPSSGLEKKILQVSRIDGDIAFASKVWLDFDLGPDVMNWNSYSSYSEGFHDVLILGNSVTFQPGEDTVLFELPIVAGSHAESDEWLDITVSPQYPDLYSSFPDSSLRLTIIDA